MTALTLVTLAVMILIWFRPRHFTFYCGRHKGLFQSRYAYPSKCPVCDEFHVIDQQMLEDGFACIGDHLAVTGGCPRLPGDVVDLIGGYRAVVVAENSGLYYRITGSYPPGGAA